MTIEKIEIIYIESGVSLLLFSKRQIENCVKSK